MPSTAAGPCCTCCTAAARTTASPSDSPCSKTRCFRPRFPPATDLIATHFLLDCLTQPELNSLALRLAAGVRPGCLWVVSEFGYPRHRLGRALARLYLRLLYAAFRALTGLLPQHLPDPERGLVDAGFRRLERRERLGGFLYAELWQLPHPVDALRAAGNAT